MKHETIVYGEPDFQSFVLREFAGASFSDGEVTMALKTAGPSIEITMSRLQARQLALELMDIANRAGQIHNAQDEDFPPHLLPSKGA